MTIEIVNIIMVPVVIIFYGYFIYLFTKRLQIREIEKQFFRAVISVLENSQDESDNIEQLEIHFKKLRERYPTLSRDPKTTIDFLEDMLYYIDTLGEKRFSTRFGLGVTSETRKRITKIINVMKSREPFGSLSREDANLLNDMKRAVETGNIDLGTTTLRQLTEEIQIKESNVRIQEKRNTTATLVAIIGAILAFVFGVLSLIR
jgi:hypothetical protein